MPKKKSCKMQMEKSGKFEIYTCGCGGWNTNLKVNDSIDQSDDRRSIVRMWRAHAS